MVTAVSRKSDKMCHFCNERGQRGRDKHKGAHVKPAALAAAVF